MMIDIKALKTKIEETNPLILNLTNYVTMDFMANALLALGASPVMSVDLDDSLELLKYSNAININIGTLDKDFIYRSISIAKKNNKQKPLILDPVGAGASDIRTKTAQELLKYSSVIRGNSGEIQVLQGEESLMKGVDSYASYNKEMISNSQHFARESQTIIAISGPYDLICNEKHSYYFSHGHEIMSKVTGMGCVLSAVTATFCAIEEDFFKASSAALMFYALCGELAYKKSHSLGFFKQYFLEELHNPNYDYIQEKINNISRLES